jgi:hypothetical protein
MAEAAALALAARTANNLNFSNNVSFLSDSSQLVQFITSEDHSHPPDWRMKPFTQEFDICTTATQANLYKISRTLNTTADALARQAFFGSETSFFPDYLYLQFLWLSVPLVTGTALCNPTLCKVTCSFMLLINMFVVKKKLFSIACM